MPRAELSLAQRAALSLLRAYKILISPMFAGSCRFLPSCSDYTAEAVRRFGVLRGTLLGARRLARCHPMGSHGLDPVPDQRPRV
jgi:putative membrane protein insertion efficiency factor